MEYFLGKTGDDMENITSELDKVISYTLGRDIITEEDIDAVCITQVTNKIFDMITAIANRQTKTPAKHSKTFCQVRILVNQFPLFLRASFLPRLLTFLDIQFLSL